MNFKEHLKKGVMYNLRTINFLPTFRRVIKEFLPDVVHFQYSNPFGLLFPFLKLRGIKSFVSTHGSEILFLREDWLGKHLFRAVLRSVNGVFSLSDYSKELVIRSGGRAERTFVIYNGTDHNFFRPIPSLRVKKDVILTVCRLMERAGEGLRTLFQG